MEGAPKRNEQIDEVDETPVQMPGEVDENYARVMAELRASHPQREGQSDEEYNAELQRNTEYTLMAEEDNVKADAEKAKIDAEKAAAEYAGSGLGKYEAQLRGRVDNGKRVHTDEEVAAMVAQRKAEIEDKQKYDAWAGSAEQEAEYGEKFDENGARRESVEGGGATEEQTSGEGETDDGEDSAEDEETREQKTRAEMVQELRGAEAMDFMVRNGDFSRKDLEEGLSDEEVAGLYEKWVAEKDGDKKEVAERVPLTERELEMMKQMLELQEKELGRSRLGYAEASAKARRLFGTMGKAGDVESGGGQREEYEEVREAYKNDAAAVLKSKMDLYLNENPGATKEDVDKRFVELWVEENKQLVSGTKDQMENGSVFRKIGKWLDKMPKWGKILTGVGLGVALGAVTGGLGLGVAGAAMASGAQAAILTRSGAERSAIGKNESLFEKQNGETDEVADEREKIMSILGRLPKDQQETYKIVSELVTNKQTEAMLKDRLDNRRRTGIAVGAAVALTLVVHGVGEALRGDAAATGRGGETAGGGEVGAGDAGGVASGSEVPGVGDAGGVAGGAEVGSAVPEFSAEALRIDPGEGFSRTFTEAFGSTDGMSAVMNDPTLRRQALDSGLAYVMGDGSLGLRLGADEAMRPFLEAVAKFLGK